MNRDITELMRLTCDMSAALARDEIDLCAALMAERGHLLESLHARYGSVAEEDVPDKLRTALAEVRTMDAELESRMARDMSLIGRRIVDLQTKTRHTGGGNSPVCLNKRV